MRAVARDLASLSGFVPEWFSDGYSLCARRPGAELFVMQQEDQDPEPRDMGTLVAVGAATPEEAERVLAPFRERLGLFPIEYRGVS
jgi:hypothetical protein